MLPRSAPRVNAGPIKNQGNEFRLTTWPVHLTGGKTPCLLDRCTGKANVAPYLGIRVAGQANETSNSRSHLPLDLSSGAAALATSSALSRIAKTKIAVAGRSARCGARHRALASRARGFGTQ